MLHVFFPMKVSLCVWRETVPLQPLPRPHTMTRIEGVRVEQKLPFAYTLNIIRYMCTVAVQNLTHYSPQMRSARAKLVAIKLLRQRAYTHCCSVPAGSTTPNLNFKYKPNIYVLLVKLTRNRDIGGVIKII